MTTIHVDYQYRNQRRTMTEIWLAWPVENRHRPNLKINVNRQPDHLSDVDPAGNQIAHFRLPPNELILLQYQFDVHSKAHVQEKLNDKEKEFYLLSSSLVPVNQEIRQYAKQIVAQTENPEEQARLLFNHVTQNYTYKFPPKERGSMAMMGNKKGDCGEYSFLFASLCRSLGMPCRVLVGSFASGKQAAHVWNEVYTEEKGWFPVDTSMASIRRKRPWQLFFSNMRAIKWRDYFGTLEGPRVVFSYNTDITPVPDYKETTPTPDAWIARMGEVDFAWGYQLLNGKIPYLQPIYTHWNGPRTVSSGWLRKLLQGVENTEYLGSWKVKEAQLFSRITAEIKRITFVLSFLSFLLKLITGLAVFGTMQGLSFLCLSLCSIIRREYPFLFLIILVLSVLSLASSIPSYFR